MMYINYLLFSVQSWTSIREHMRNMYGQTVHFRESVKSAYIRSASSDRDNKWYFLLGLVTKLLLALLLVSGQSPYDLRSYVLSLYEISIEKFIGLRIIYLYIKASSNFACGMKSCWNCKKSIDLMSKIVVLQRRIYHHRIRCEVIFLAAC